MVGVAVKVTDVPTQTLLPEAEIDTLAGSNGFTIIVIELELTGLPVGQVAFEVNWQVIASLLTGT